MEQSSFVQVLHSRKFWALVIALVAIMAGYGTGNLDAWQAIQALVAALAAYSTGVAIEDAGFKAGANRPATPVYELPATPAPLNTAGSSMGPAAVTKDKELQAVGRVSGESAAGSSARVGASQRVGASPTPTMENTVPPNESDVAPEGKVLRQQLSRPYPRVKWEG